MQPRRFTTITVRRRIGAPHFGRVIAGGRILPCALGRTSPRAIKREGDGGTPRGRFALLGLWYRPDRGRPRSGLPLRATRPSDGWCDAPDHRNYNRPVALPCAASHERMWRDDRLYDLVIDIDWNRSCRSRGRGSAIFMHVARAGFAATEGCIALKLSDLRWLVRHVDRRTRIAIL